MKKRAIVLLIIVTLLVSTISVSAASCFHVFNDDCNKTCIKCGQSGGVNHNYVGHWYDVGTSSVCREHVRTCTECGITKITKDTTHSWTNSSDTTCNSCGYTR
jgi:hypothetical protein